MEVRENGMYQRSQDDTDIVRVLDIYVKDGNTIIRGLPVCKSYDNDFYCGSEDTKNWKKVN